MPYNTPTILFMMMMMTMTNVSYKLFPYFSIIIILLLYYYSSYHEFRSRRHIQKLLRQLLIETSTCRRLTCVILTRIRKCFTNQTENFLFLPQPESVWLSSSTTSTFNITQSSSNTFCIHLLCPSLYDLFQYLLLLLFSLSLCFVRFSLVLVYFLLCQSDMSHCLRHLKE